MPPTVTGRSSHHCRSSKSTRASVEVPEGLDPLDAAPLTGAGVTTYKAVKVAGTRSSDLVAAFGIGGLGHLAVRMLRSPAGGPLRST